MNFAKVKNSARIVFAVGALCLSLMLLVSCAPTDAKSPAQLNREYMASVSQSTENLGSELDVFIEAAAAGDIPGMKIAADRAEKEMENIKGLTAPKDLEAAHNEYCAGLDELDTALDEYIDLYSMIEAGTISSMDAKTRLAEIQKTYDSGIKHLEAGDALTVELSSADEDRNKKNAPEESIAPQTDDSEADAEEK